MALLTRAGSPYELESHLGEHGPQLRYKHSTGSLRDLARKGARRGNSPFLVCPTGIFTYDYIFKRAWAVGTTLQRQYQVRPGARIGILASSGPDWVISFFGILFANAIPVLTNVSCEDVVAHCLEAVNPSFIITDREHEQYLRHRDGCCVVDATNQRDLTYGGSSEQDLSSDQLYDGLENMFSVNGPLGLISFTSGSTGKPKALLCTDRAINTGLLNMMCSGALANMYSNGPARATRGSATGTCALTTLPLYHVGGYSPLLSAVMTGGRVAISPVSYELRKFVRENRVTALLGLNTEEVIQLLAQSDIHHDLDSVRSWNISGLPLRKTVARTIGEKLPNVILTTGYGLTETCGGISTIAGNELLSRPESCGRLAPTAEIRVTDDYGSTVDTGTAGNVWLRGPMMMSGYIEKDDSLSGLDTGWFRTGDIGFLSPDKHLNILDRVSDIITFYSKTISSGEVERWATEMGNIHDACLVEFECCGDEYLGLAVVGEKITDERTSALAVGLAHLLDVPRARVSIMSVGRMPRTVSGKVLRIALRDMFISSQMDPADAQMRTNG